MQCPVCKMILSDSFRFCPSCGTQIQNSQNYAQFQTHAAETKAASEQISQFAQAQGTSAVPQMISIQGGPFNMGAGSIQFFISSFEIASIPVTQTQYQFITGNNPSKLKGKTNPVESVTWSEALIYCNRLSQRYGLAPCYSIGGEANLEQFLSAPQHWARVQCNFGSSGFRLPTEAEWEFAARCGNGTLTYSGSNNINDVAWYGENSEIKTHPVAQKKPNAFGIYDMCGNVNEWVWDYLGDYNSAAKVNPTGPNVGNLRVKRGGSWLDDAEQCTTLYRSGSAPFGKSSSLGFRICRTTIPGQK